MSIKMYNVYIGVLLRCRPECAERDQVLAADHKRYLTVVQNDLSALLDLIEHSLSISDTKLDISAVHYAYIFKISVLIRTVRLDTERLASYGVRTEAGAGTKRRRRIERCAEHNDVRIFILLVTCKESLNIILQHF